MSDVDLRSSCIMVSIYMKESDDSKWIRALNIPLGDIARLSLRPLKWLRFLAFAVLGAKSDLYDGPIPGSNIVNYESVSHADLAESYYYFVPNGNAPMSLATLYRQGALK